MSQLTWGEHEKLKVTYKIGTADSGTEVVLQSPDLV